MPSRARPYSLAVTVGVTSAGAPWRRCQPTANRLLRDLGEVGPFLTASIGKQRTKQWLYVLAGGDDT